MEPGCGNISCLCNGKAQAAGTRSFVNLRALVVGYYSVESFPCNLGVTRIFTGKNDRIFLVRDA
jgi:hypothetical protein